MRRTADVVRAIVASAAIALLVVGLPGLLLTSVGWPLPRQLPHLSDVADTLTGHQPLETSTVWKILAVILWLAWFQVLTAVIVESVSVARGSLPRSISGLNLAHGLVAPLVAAIVLVWPAGAATRASAAPAPPMERRDPPATKVVETPPPPTTEPVSASPATPIVTEHLVERRDTLWDLAERYLGDGYRAPEIFELNRGRPQPDGRALTDPSLIRPGWVLQIPVSSATPHASAESVLVEPGDTLWEIAEERLGDGHRFDEVFDLNRGDFQPDGGALANPSLIRPGWRLEIPSAPQASAPPVVVPQDPTATRPTAVPPAEAVPAPPTNTGPVPSPAVPTKSPERAPTDVGRSSVPASGALGVAGGLLGAGIASVVALRRRRRAAQRPEGLELGPLPAGAPLADLVTDDIDLAVAVDITIRAMAPLLAQRTLIPAPLVAIVEQGMLELLLDRPDRHDPPDGWSTDADGWIWRVPLATDTTERGSAWTPAFVSIGAADAGGLLLNLEALGAIGIVGDENATREFAASIAMELAVGILGGASSVHLVHGGPYAEVSVPGFHVHGSVEEAIAAARREVATTDTALRATGAEDVFELRCRAGDEPWPPSVVVVDADTSNEAAVSELVALSRTRAGIAAAIVGACPGGATEVRVTEAEVSVPGLGLACAPQVLDAGRTSQLVALLAAADEPAGDPGLDREMTLFDAPFVGGASSVASALRLRILGPIEVHGVELKPQQVAVLAYLVLHPDATADALRDAVWGGRPPTQERFLNTMHELRRAVGADVLPASVDGRYRVRGIACDAWDFERIRASGGAGTDDTLPHLRAALELIAGPPVTYESRHRRHYTWVDLENHANRWERIVCDSAHELATQALDLGDTELARWAAERGLVASPASDLLTHDLVLAHVAAGDRRAAERVADAYARTLEDLGLDEPHELYDLIDGRRAS